MRAANCRFNVRSFTASLFLGCVSDSNFYDTITFIDVFNSCYGENVYVKFITIKSNYIIIIKIITMSTGNLLIINGTVEFLSLIHI